MPSEEIKKYIVNYFGGGINDANRHPYRALIGLYKDNTNRIGLAYFHRDSETMPDGDIQDAAGHIYCHYASEDYPRVLDLLRNEKPVYLRYYAGIASIDTSKEPVGQEETS